MEKINGITVLIPAYNEEMGIGEVITRVHQVLREKCPYEILVINDGSTDRTAVIAEAAGARVMSHPRNVGYGFSLKHGLHEAQYECVCLTDADGTYPIEKIPELIQEYEKGFDMVVGARSGSAYITSAAKRISRLCFKLMSEFVVGKKIADINSGFRVVRRSKILPLLPDLSNTFSFTTSVTLIFFLKHYFVTYLPITYGVRQGKSKVRYIRDALIATQIMVEIIAKYNPIKLFLLLAVPPFLWSIVCGVIFFTSRNAGFLLAATVAALGAWLLVSIGCYAAIFRKQ